MRLACRYHTSDPSIPFPQLIAEATLAYNASPHDSLWNNMSPRDAHFVRSCKDFLHTAAEEPIQGVSRSLADAVKAARTAGHATLAVDVASHIRRKQLRSPTNWTRRLKIGDLALRKRTTWPSSTPKKLGWKIVVDAYRVTSRVATNSFRVTSLLTQREFVFPGDILIKVRMKTEEELVELCRRMEEVAERNSARPSRPMTRRSTAEASAAADADASTNDSQISSTLRRPIPSFDWEPLEKENKSTREDYNISSLF